jgi:radical SAM protein with 4Fe4S-binding SPASM domain
MILKKIRANRLGYNLGRKILESPLANNKLYDSIYNKRITKTIKRLENSYPIAVDIGTTNFCNAACIMCPHSKLQTFGTMDMGLYMKIIDNCQRLNIREVNLSFFGEPFLDKDIVERIEYAKKHTIKVGMFSNGSMLNESIINQIIKVGLDSITISFDGATKETYDKVRKNLDFNIVRDNILNLIKYRNENNSKVPEINLVLVELEENKKEIKQFYKYWKKKVDNINIINMRNWTGDIQKEGTKESFHYSKSKRKPCALLWIKMVVDWNGDVVLCCDDWNHSVILGNLKTQNIEDVWNSNKLKYIRDAHKKGEFHHVSLCTSCNKKSVWWLI